MRGSPKPPSSGTSPHGKEVLPHGTVVEVVDGQERGEVIGSGSGWYKVKLYDTEEVSACVACVW
jgi:hypothetical protein